MKDLEYIVQSSDIPNDVKQRISHNEGCFYYILAVYKDYLERLRDLELKKKRNQITKAEFYKRYEILKLAFAACMANRLEHFIEEIEREEDER